MPVAAKCENKDEVTKTIRLGEYKRGEKSIPTGTYFVSSSVEQKDGYIQGTNYTPRSWGYTNYLSSLDGEFFVANVLQKIAEQNDLPDTREALTLLASKGEEGIQLTLTAKDWESLQRPFGVTNFPSIPNPSELFQTTDIGTP